MSPIKISFLFGTRPELVKLAPLILASQQDTRFETDVVFSGQHDELARDAIEFFGIRIDHTLKMMHPGQSLTELLARGLLQIEGVYKQAPKRDVIVVQGDTATVLAGAWVAFAHRISLAHVEAGLRSFDLEHPFPEEANRQLATRLARWHFAPTELSAKNLKAEGIADAQIVVTGNTVVDAVHWAKDRLDDDGSSALSHHFSELKLGIPDNARVILVTAHRRENFGEGIANICTAIAQLLEQFPDVHIVWPVHLNPAVHDFVHQRFADHPCVHLVPPLSYPKLMAVLNQAVFALTDSGGIQEECPSFGKPVLILRTTTERPEVLHVGAGKLVGTDTALIVQSAKELLEDPAHYQRMASAINPFGDGQASRRILDKIAGDLGR